MYRGRTLFLVYLLASYNAIVSHLHVFRFFSLIEDEKRIRFVSKRTGIFCFEFYCVVAYIFGWICSCRCCFSIWFGFLLCTIVDFLQCLAIFILTFVQPFHFVSSSVMWPFVTLSSTVIYWFLFPSIADSSSCFSFVCTFTLLYVKRIKRRQKRMHVIIVKWFLTSSEWEREKDIHTQREKTAESM